MNDTLPSISFVIPTFNSERVLDKCLESIRMQNYPSDKIEIIIVDGASSDKTLEIARKFKVDKILKNPLVTGEAGKAIGVDACKNELVAFVDSDNLLESEDWLKKMVTPFENPEIVSSEVLYWIYRKEDSIIDRYCALMGINDPVCMFLGNYDRYNYLTGKWTELPLKEEIDRGEYLEVVLDKNYVPTMGANGYLVRRNVLSKIDYRPYYFDVDVVWQLVRLGYSRIARPKIGIRHLYCGTIKSFIRKQRRRINDYLYFRRKGMRSYNYKINSLDFLRYIMHTLLTFPLFLQAFAGYRKKPDFAWFFHPLACWITLGIYCWGTIRGTLMSQIQDRSKWSQ